MTVRGALAGGLATLVALSMSTGSVVAATYATIGTFAGTDGAFPESGLLASSAGILYGTALGGGVSQDLSVGGVAFSLAPTASGWTRTVIHQFNQVTGDGSSPHSSLVADRNGALYGTTYSGGARNQGTVYRLTPPSVSGGAWQSTVIYSFTGAADGANPVSEVIFDAAGNLYGTTSIGGPSQQGTVYRLSPPSSGAGAWSLQVLRAFSGSDGASPRGGLLGRTSAGVFTLFGTTSGGGPFSKGTVFSLASPASGSSTWAYTLLHGFTGGSDGAMPVATLVADLSMTLYGTAMQGGVVLAGTSLTGGVVFRLKPPAVGQLGWTEMVLHSFTGGADGMYPLGGVIERAGGRLFGTSAGSRYGGCNANCGTAFMLTPKNGGNTSPWNETVLHVFNGIDGDLPTAGLASIQGAGGALSFFGVTEWGGVAGLGSLFQTTP